MDQPIVKFSDGGYRVLKNARAPFLEKDGKHYFVVGFSFRSTVTVVDENNTFVREYCTQKMTPTVSVV